MRPKISINEIQAGVMRRLFAHGDLRFAQLNDERNPSDQFSYHLRQLIRLGLIEKDPDNIYRLSVAGRSRAMLLEPDSGEYMSQGLLAVRVVLTRELDGQEQILVQERTKVPFQGRLMTPGGPIRYGEDVSEAAARLMLEQSGLVCNLQPAGVVHFKESYEDEVVQDKYFVVLRGTSPRGQLKPRGESGLNLWLAPDQIWTAPGHPGMMKLIEVGLGRGPTFLEESFALQEY